MRAFAWIVLLAGCVDVPPFHCEEDAQCGAAGRCEDDGACSFEDESCHAGRRYGDLGAADVAGRCIGDESGEVLALASGSDHACAVAGAGRLWCWGDNTSGNLGRDEVDASSAPAPIDALGEVADVDGGEYHTCAVAAGLVQCWGRNDKQQLGDDTTTGRWEPMPVPDLIDAVEVDLGEQHSCARTLAGEVWCWGDNADHECDHTGRATLGTPERCDLPPATQLTAGGQTNCALTDEGVYCWGKNANGQLGVGDRDAHMFPQPVPGFDGAIQIAAGGEHTCAVMADRTVACTGANADGQLGDGSGTLKSSPVRVAGLADVEEVALLDWSTCARTGAGDVICWGRNDFGQLGAPGDDRATPGAAVPLPRPAIELVAGENHACAQTDDGCVWCWGKDEQGQLGAGRGDQGGTVAPTLLSCY